MSRIDTVDLDSRFLGEPEQSTNASTLEGILRPIPDGDFELVALGEDPTRGVKIGADLPDLAKRQLKACLRENTDLLDWSSAEMPGLDPEVSCHHLTIDPACKAVAQRRRKQSPEKTAAAELAVKDLLEAKFISEAKFVAKSAQHALPLFKLLRKETAFEWTEECERALFHLKQALSSPLVLSRPEAGEILYLYLAVSTEAVSTALIRETPEGQKPIYFTSKALQGPKVKYQQIEKVGLPLITAARRLRHYFLAHTIVVRTEQPVKQLLARPDMAGRMLCWSLELTEFDIKYKGRKALKAQVLADFVAEMAFSETTNNNARRWTLYVEGASSSTGSGAGIILENGEGTLIEVSLSLSFPTSNNQAEYEALLAGMRLANDLEAEEIEVFTYSQLVASYISGEYQVKSEALAEYLALVRERLTRFRSAKVKHIPREHNSRADVLSKLASTRRKGGNKYVIQEILPKPSTESPSSLTLVNPIGDASFWMTPVYNYLTSDHLPVDPKEASVIRRRACSYVLVENRLYRRGFSIPLLKCIDEGTVPHILREIHEGINLQHLGGRSLARKALRAGYYWPTMQGDTKEYIKK
ncbi:uncharacterized protein LOC131597305 [Vicia villosa]|uniref:uncharacterized protein LOC131597305 n=1 Tax=Vicia villosa TaxID=3911 RepID=UPI00273BF44F|nr:uncharacterized protein LOC131597305 [Vicia villosa]